MRRFIAKLSGADDDDVGAYFGSVLCSQPVRSSSSSLVLLLWMLLVVELVVAPPRMKR